jgi:hypothetical protein
MDTEEQVVYWIYIANSIADWYTVDLYNNAESSIQSNMTCDASKRNMHSRHADLLTLVIL